MMKMIMMATTIVCMYVDFVGADDNIVVVALDVCK